MNSSHIRQGNATLWLNQFMNNAEQGHKKIKMMGKEMLRAKIISIRRDEPQNLGPLKRN